jgi:hypothetical protein
LPPALFGTVDTALAEMVSKPLSDWNDAASTAFLALSVDALEGSLAGPVRQGEHDGEMLSMGEKKKKSANRRSKANGFRCFCC